jgi:DNA-binding IclR family transcriptional regulator
MKVKRQPDGLFGDDEGPRGVSLAEVAKRLNLDKSAAQRRLANPLKQGYVQNLESRPGRAARYVPGDELPPPVVALPTVEEIAAAMGAEVMDL